MSANPDLRVCHVEKIQKSLVDFVAQVRTYFEQHREDLRQVPHSEIVEWSRNLLRSSQDLKCSDQAQQPLLEDLRGFVKEIRKVLTKHEHNMHEISAAPIIEHATNILRQAGYEDVSLPSPRRLSP